ncbi:hypothetical protein [Haladaptatus sp. DJG-WS-42]|uniref:hypothetical protein n=1 Tax=Haladaptatus sp. DJG-WS-42 TaxID=3120516 RepID=UPI0030CBB5D5
MSVEPDEAAARISARVAHLRRTRDGKNYDYTTNIGLHLATLSPASSRDGRRKSKLRYRTSIIGPHLFHAHNKAGEIRNAVKSMQVR